MDKTPLKKVKMMDIVRKQAQPERKEINPLLRGEQRVPFSIEKKKEPLRAELHKEEAPVHVHETMPHAALEVVNEERYEKSIPVEHAAPRILETHIPSETSSLELERPIAYIPKEKPSKEEKKMFERIEKRERAQRKEGSQGKGKSIFVWATSCILLGLGAYIALAVLPRAEIMLIAKKVQWEYANPIGANTKIAEIDAATRQIPVAVFLEKKTNAFKFPATGAGKSIERKATGKVTIYNEFSESTQPLVAGTRLETPDGKIFRLVERVVVPGAKKTGGELIATSIEADVVADKAGESYNISPVNKFTIPGFAGTTKFEGFYASSKDAMTGGFIGEGKYPTVEDIKTAKESAKSQMQGLIESFLQTLVLDGFKTIEGSKKYTVTKEMVNEAVDEEGNFSVYIEAEGGIDALKEDHVLELMTALAQQVNGAEYIIKEHTISYGEITVDKKTGIIALPIDFKGTFWKPINIEEFKNAVMGKTQDELKAYIFSSTSIERADVALWPGWVQKVPTDTERVKVELQ